VNAFWSVTMYTPQSFFVANPLNRYAVSSWMPFKKNADGSLDIYIQSQSPGKDKEANWLPAPEGEFNLTMRMYWPKETDPRFSTARGSRRRSRWRRSERCARGLARRGRKRCPLFLFFAPVRHLRRSSAVGSIQRRDQVA